jgi:hypothetical protein
MLRVTVPPDHTHTHTRTRAHTNTFGRTPLDEGSVHRIEFYLTHNTAKRKTVMPPAELETAISASGRPLDHAVTGIG